MWLSRISKYKFYNQVQPDAAHVNFSVLWTKTGEILFQRLCTSLVGSSQLFIKKSLEASEIEKKSWFSAWEYSSHCQLFYFKGFKPKEKINHNLMDL